MALHPPRAKVLIAPAADGGGLRLMGAATEEFVVVSMEVVVKAVSSSVLALFELAAECALPGK